MDVFRETSLFGSDLQLEPSERVTSVVVGTDSDRTSGVAYTAVGRKDNLMSLEAELQRQDCEMREHILGMGDGVAGRVVNVSVSTAELRVVLELRCM